MPVTPRGRAAGRAEGAASVQGGYSAAAHPPPILPPPPQQSHHQLSTQTSPAAGASAARRVSSASTAPPPPPGLLPPPAQPRSIAVGAPRAAQLAAAVEGQATPPRGPCAARSASRPVDDVYERRLPPASCSPPRVPELWAPGGPPPELGGEAILAAGIDEERSAALAARLGAQALAARLRELRSERDDWHQQVRDAEAELEAAAVRQAAEEQALQQELREVEEGIAELSKAAAAAEGRCAGALMAARQAQEIERGLRATGGDGTGTASQVLAEGRAAAELLAARERELAELREEKERQMEHRAAADERRHSELRQANAARKAAEAERAELAAQVAALREKAKVSGEEASDLDTQLKEGLMQHKRADASLSRMRDHLEQLHLQAAQQEEDHARERELLTRELGQVGMQGVEDIKVAWDNECARMEEELRRMAVKELELREQADAALAVCKQAEADAQAAEKEHQEVVSRVLHARTELERQRHDFDSELKNLRQEVSAENRRLDLQVHKANQNARRRPGVPPPGGASPPAARTGSGTQLKGSGGSTPGPPSRAGSAALAG